LFDVKKNNVKLEILDKSGNAVRTLTSNPEKAGKGGGKGVKYRIPAKPGLNKAVWDLAYDPLPGIKDSWSYAWGNNEKASGMTALPGDYTLRLSISGDGAPQKYERPLSVKFDPRYQVSADQWLEKQALMADITSLYSDIIQSVVNLRSAKAQLEQQLLYISDAELKAQAEKIAKAIGEWEDSVFSDERTFFQDVLNWPDRLVANISILTSDINNLTPPMTEGVKLRLNDMKTGWVTAKEARDAIIHTDIAAFNALYRAKQIDIIAVKGKPAS